MSQKLAESEVGAAFKFILPIMLFEGRRGQAFVLNRALAAGNQTALIDYLFITFTVPECTDEANCDGSTNGVVDIGDLTALIDYLFITFTPPAECL